MQFIQFGLTIRCLEENEREKMGTSFFSSFSSPHLKKLQLGVGLAGLFTTTSSTFIPSSMKYISKVMHNLFTSIYLSIYRTCFYLFHPFVCHKKKRINVFQEKNEFESLFRRKSTPTGDFLCPCEIFDIISPVEHLLPIIKRLKGM